MELISIGGIGQKSQIASKAKKPSLSQKSDKFSCFVIFTTKLKQDDMNMFDCAI